MMFLSVLKELNLSFNWMITDTLYQRIFWSGINEYAHVVKWLEMQFVHPDDENETELEEIEAWLKQRPAPDKVKLNERYSSTVIWIACVVVVVLFVITGLLLHALHSWAGQNSLIGSLVPINESLWEQLKLIHTPAVTIGFIVWLIVGKYTHNHMTAIFLSTIFSMLFVIVVFYIYVGIFGQSVVAVDVIIYIFAVILLVAVFYYYSVQHPYPHWALVATFVGLSILSILFFVFSYFPPSIPLFESPR